MTEQEQRELLEAVARERRREQRWEMAYLIFQVLVSGAIAVGFWALMTYREWRIWFR